MKLELDVVPVGTEIYALSMSFDVFKVRVTNIRVWISDPTSINIEHLVRSVDEIEDFAKQPRFHTLTFNDLFETEEEAMAERTVRMKAFGEAWNPKKV